MLTGVIVAHKDKNIKQCIDALDFCDEVLVMRNNGETALDFGTLRNKALKQAKNEWVLYIDTDEEVSDVLKKEILKVIKNTEFSSFYIKRKDLFWKKPVLYGEVLHARTHGLVRLVKKGSGQWSGAVHEVFTPNSTSGTLNNEIVHNAHDSIAGFLLKINFYSTLRANELFKAGKKTNIFEIICMPIGKFVYSFFVLQGYKDAERGFVYSFMMSFHSFLVRSKLFLLSSKS